MLHARGVYSSTNVLSIDSVAHLDRRYDSGLMDKARAFVVFCLSYGSHENFNKRGPPKQENIAAKSLKLSI